MPRRICDIEMHEWVPGEDGMVCQACGIKDEDAGEAQASRMDSDDEGDEQAGGNTKAKPYDGPPCPRRCLLCNAHSEQYATEHHWMLDYGDEEDGTFKEEGFLSCRHCDAQRDLPIDDEEFLQAFNL